MSMKSGELQNILFPFIQFVKKLAIPACFTPPPSPVRYFMIHASGYRESPRTRSRSARDGIVDAVILLLFNQLRRNMELITGLGYMKKVGFWT